MANRGRRPFATRYSPFAPMKPKGSPAVVVQASEGKGKMAEDVITTTGIAHHGAARLPSVDVDSFNIELKDDDGFLGDRASKGAFRKILDDLRKPLKKNGDDPLGGKSADKISKSELDAALQGEDVGAAALVHDLGRPERFLNMLRTIKLTSPMSLGSWILSAFSAGAGVAAAGCPGACGGGRVARHGRGGHGAAGGVRAGHRGRVHRRRARLPGPVPARLAHARPAGPAGATDRAARPLGGRENTRRAREQGTAGGLGCRPGCPRRSRPSRSRSRPARSC